MLFSALLALLPLAAAAPVEIAKRQGFSGRATFYDVGLGACGGTNVASDFIVALNAPQYGSGYPGPNCGRQLRISYGGKSTTATVRDQCPGCGYGDLDLSRGLFNFFASEDVGVFQMSWTWADGSGGGDQAQPEPTTTKAPEPSTNPSPTPTPTSTYTPPTTTATPSPSTTERVQILASAAPSSASASTSSSSAASSASASASSASGSASGSASATSASASASASGAPADSQVFAADNNLAAIASAIVALGKIVIAGKNETGSA